MDIYRNKYAIKKAKDILNKEGQVVEVKLDKIYDNPYQPRIEIKKKELEELANSIKEKGLLQPVLVFNDKKENKLYLIAGHRRYYAHKLLGKEKIKVIYVNGIEKKDLASIAITENLQREDLDIIETAIAIKRYKEEFNKTLDEIGKELGKTKSWISRMLSVLSLPQEIIDDVKNNKSTSDVDSLNLINSISKFDKKFRMRNFCPECRDIGDFQGWLHKNFLKNGRDWLRETIDKLKNQTKPKEIKDVEYKFTKNGATIKINKKLSDEDKQLLEELIKDLLEKIKDK
jgi:ParB family chromosome partitioning protein